MQMLVNLLLIDFWTVLLCFSVSLHELPFTVFKIAVHRNRIPKSVCANQFAFDPTTCTIQVEENSRTFKKQNGNQGLFKAAQAHEILLIKHNSHSFPVIVIKTKKGIL